MFPFPIIYVTRDLERALGIPLGTPNYFVLTNTTTLSRNLNHPHIFSVAGDTLLDTWQLLESPAMYEFMKENPTAHIVVFKNTVVIERICQKNNWPLLNPDATLAQTIEEKISQITWLGPLTSFLPPHRIETCNLIAWNNEPFILQFNRAHTGGGTFLVESSEDLRTLQQKFPHRDARVTSFIEGSVITSNNVVTMDTVLVGNINYQITGIPPFTNNPFATIGNDWALPHALLTAEQYTAYTHMTTQIGNRLRDAGWKGLFGIDVMIEKTTGKLFLLEINARQPASTTYESQLQRRADSSGLTTFGAHLYSLIEQPIMDAVTPLSTGSQIIVRIEASRPPEHSIKNTIQELETLGCSVMLYDNMLPGSELLRIQLEQGLILPNGGLNTLGTAIQTCISGLFSTL